MTEGPDVPAGDGGASHAGDPPVMPDPLNAAPTVEEGNASAPTTARRPCPGGAGGRLCCPDCKHEGPSGECSGCDSPPPGEAEYLALRIEAIDEGAARATDPAARWICGPWVAQIWAAVGPLLCWLFAGVSQAAAGGILLRTARVLAFERAFHLLGAHGLLVLHWPHLAWLLRERARVASDASEENRLALRLVLVQEEYGGAGEIGRALACLFGATLDRELERAARTRANNPAGDGFSEAELERLAVAQVLLAVVSAYQDDPGESRFPPPVRALLRLVAWVEPGSKVPPIDPRWSDAERREVFDWLLWRCAEVCLEARAVPEITGDRVFPTPRPGVLGGGR